MDQFARGYSIYEEPEGTHFTEGWCTDLEKSAIEHSYSRVADLDGLCIEIGCFEGRSAVFTANLIAPNTLICIDPWEPVEYAPYEVKVYNERPIFEHFKNNISKGTEGNVRICQMPYEQWFAENVEELEEKGIKYLYLDGPHGYEDVQLGLETVLPYMAPGSVLIGDDYDDHIVASAVNDYFNVDSCFHPMSGRTFEWLV